MDVRGVFFLSVNCEIYHKVTVTKKGGLYQVVSNRFNSLISNVHYTINQEVQNAQFCDYREM